MIKEIIFINWACIFLMLIGLVMILSMKKKIDYIPTKFYNLSFYVLLLSTGLYIIKVFILNMYPRSNFYLISIYLDWLIITPVLLDMLGSIGMYYDHKDESLTIKIIIIYGITIMSFLISNHSSGVINIITLLISCVFFIINLWIIWGPLENIASLQGCYAYKLYKSLALYTTSIWIGYLALWGIGPRVFNIVNYKFYIYLCVIIPTIYKLGFIYLTLDGLKNLNKIKKE